MTWSNGQHWSKTAKVNACSSNLLFVFGLVTDLSSTAVSHQKLGMVMIALPHGLLWGFDKILTIFLSHKNEQNADTGCNKEEL